jgi:hypothetical protein
MNSQRSSHTHCQAAQAQAQSQACQRVCLFQPKRRISKFFSHALERKKFKTRQSASSRTGTRATQTVKENETNEKF